MFNLKTINYNKRKDLKYSNLTYEITINKYDNPINILNSLRRTIMCEIPIYAFEPSIMIFNKNTSIKNNTQLRDDFSQIPIYDFKHDNYYMNPIDDYMEYIQSKEYQNENKIEMYISVKNETKDYLSITTNSEFVKYVVNNEVVENPYSKKYPILLLKLKPNQELNCKLVGVLGIGRINTIWSAVSNCYVNYEKEDITTSKAKNNKFKLVINSNGQLDEYDIFDKACDNIIYNLRLLNNKINSFLNNIEDNKINQFEISLYNSALSKLINDQLQLDNKVKYAGLQQPNLLEKLYKMKIILDKEYEIKDIKEIIDNNINKLINMFSELKDLNVKEMKKN